MESGIYLTAHKSGLKGRGASGRRLTLQTHASDGERGHTALQARPPRPLPCPEPRSLLPGHQARSLPPRPPPSLVGGGVCGQSWHHGWVSVCDQQGPQRGSGHSRRP